MASNSNEGTSTPLEVLEFLKWPLPTMAEEHMLLSDEDVVEGLTAEVALRLMYERDPSEVSQELKARLAFMAAGYTPVTEDGSQALQLLWHTWVSTNLGAPTKWSDAARDYITSGTQLLLGLEPEGAGVDDPSDLQAQDDPPAQLDQDGDVAMGDGGLVAALKKSSGVAIPPHPSLNVGAGSSASGHQQVVRDGVIKLKLDLSMSGSSDPHCFRRIDTVEDGGETLREIRQRWTRCLNQSSKTKTLTLPSVSAEDVTQFLKRVRLEAVKLLENAELGDGIRYPDLDPQHEMVAMVGLRIMETKLVASIQTHLPTPLAWDGLVTAVNTQVSSQRKASYFYALARDVRGRVDYKGGDSKWSTFMNQFRTRFETFAEQMKCEDSAILEQAQVALTFVNLPYNMQDEVIDRTKEKFPGRFFPPTMADFTALVQAANTDLETRAAQAEQAQKRAASATRGGATPRGGRQTGGSRDGGRGQQPQKPSGGTPWRGRGRGNGQSRGRGDWGRGSGRPGGGRDGGRDGGRGDKKHVSDAKNTDASKKQKK